jgi:hypothetical protein
VPAIEPSTSARPMRRRLLAHAAVFAAAGLACLALSSPTTSAAPTVQDGRYLEGGSLDIDYTCTGADAATTSLLNAFGLNNFPMPITITSAAVEPAPSPGEDFTTEFTWNFVLPASITDFAIGLGVTDFTISNGVNPMTATTGATGTAAGTGGDPAFVDLLDTVANGFTAGPYSGTFNRTAAVDAPIVFTPQPITSTVTTNAGTALNLACSPGAGTIEVVDQTGVAPSTTTTTLGSIAPPTTPTTAAVGGGGAGQGGSGGELPATGTSSNLFLVLLALGLIDVGYLAISASRRTQSVS